MPTLLSFDSAKDKDKNISNKDISVKKIHGIKIKKFRNMNDSTIKLSDRITLISGHNGTMKSTLIGLFVQNFNSDQKDIFDTPLKTQFKDIFRLSSEYDKERYEYDLVIQDEAENDLKIPVYTKPRSKDDPSIRIVTGGNTKLDGNLVFNTNYLNLNRLYSIHTTNSSPTIVNLSVEEKKFVSEFYNIVLQKNTYRKMETISDKEIKKTFGPIDGTYNFESISSGEDNLGRILISLLSFMRIHANRPEASKNFNGIFCIDEIEASLHPIAQVNLFNFLYKWSNRYKVQILMTTHSLPLIRHAIENKNAGKDLQTYYLSTLYTDEIDVISNPKYESIYKELTFEYEEKTKVEIPKIDLLCEDDLAKRFIKLMVAKASINNRINFVTFDSTEGFPYNFLIKLCNTASAFVENTLIVFDADVSAKSINNIKKKENILQLPDSTYKLPIEKMFILYLYEKDKTDEVFKKTLKMPKDAFLRTLTESNIIISDTNDLGSMDSKHFKTWFKNNGIIVNKVFNTFAKTMEERTEFVESLLIKMNKINKKNGYPMIEL